MLTASIGGNFNLLLKLWNSSQTSTYSKFQYRFPNVLKFALKHFLSICQGLCRVRLQSRRPETFIIPQKQVQKGSQRTKQKSKNEVKTRRLWHDYCTIRTTWVEQDVCWLTLETPTGFWSLAQVSVLFFCFMFKKRALLNLLFFYSLYIYFFRLFFFKSCNRALSRLHTVILCFTPQNHVISSIHQHCKHKRCTCTQSGKGVMEKQV